LSSICDPVRVRKDTGTRKYDEIANKAYEYGSSMIGDDFNLFINGYSLGGGLGVLFGFHASTDERYYFVLLSLLSFLFH
jgi:hypothetical protein